MIFKKMGEYNPKIDYLICRSLLTTIPREFDDLRLKQVFKELVEPMEMHEKELIYIKDTLSVSNIYTPSGTIDFVNAVTGCRFKVQDLPNTNDVEDGIKAIIKCEIEEKIKASFVQLFILHYNLASNMLIIPYRKCIYKMLMDESKIPYYLLNMRARTDKYLKSHDIKYNAEAFNIVVDKVSEFCKKINAIGVGIYGSIASGSSTQYSDLDILVVVDDDTHNTKQVKREALDYWRMLLPIEVDVCAVRTSDFNNLPIGIKGTLKMLEGKVYD